MVVIAARHAKGADNAGMVAGSTATSWLRVPNIDEDLPGGWVVGAVARLPADVYRRGRLPVVASTTVSPPPSSETKTRSCTGS